MFSIFKASPKPDPDYLHLLDKLEETKDNLYLAYEHFENATEPELIDSYIYEVNAMQMRYKFLLGRVKAYDLP